LEKKRKGVMKQIANNAMGLSFKLLPLKKGNDKKAWQM
jgi:hypothetical protein